MGHSHKSVIERIAFDATFILQENSSTKEKHTYIVMNSQAFRRVLRIMQQRKQLNKPEQQPAHSKRMGNVNDIHDPDKDN